MGANQQYLKLAKSLSKMIRGFANLIQHGFVLLAYMAVVNAGVKTRHSPE